MSWRKGRQPDLKRWRRARREVLERDNWTCQTCGKYGNEVDHITPIDRMAADADLCALDALQTLCRSDHIAKSRGECALPTPGREAWRELVARMVGT